MEPIRLWRVRDQLGALSWITALPAVHEQAWRDLIESEWVASPRADFDALAAEAADARTLRAERDSLVKERDEARDALVGIKSIHAEDGRVDAKFAGEFVKAFSAGFVQMYRDSGAKNYLDIKFIDRTTGEAYTVTVQRDLGKTAHALRTEAEAARDAATARADKAEALLMEARGWLAALLKVGADKPAVDALRARIDALLEKPNG